MFIASMQRVGLPFVPREERTRENFQPPKFSTPHFLEHITRLTVNRAIIDPCISKSVLISKFHTPPMDDEDRRNGFDSVKQLEKNYVSLGFRTCLLDAADRGNELRQLSNDFDARKLERVMSVSSYFRCLQGIKLGYMIGAMHSWLRERDQGFQPSDCIILVRPHLNYLAELAMLCWPTAKVHLGISEEHNEKIPWEMSRCYPEICQFNLDSIARELPPYGEEEKFGTRLNIPYPLG